MHYSTWLRTVHAAASSVAPMHLAKGQNVCAIATTTQAVILTALKSASRKLEPGQENSWPVRIGHVTRRANTILNFVAPALSLALLQLLNILRSTPLRAKDHSGSIHCSRRCGVQDVLSGLEMLHTALRRRRVCGFGRGWGIRGDGRGMALRGCRSASRVG